MQANGSSSETELNAAVTRVSPAAAARRESIRMKGLKNGTYFLLAAAAIALVLSVSLWFSGHREEG